MIKNKIISILIIISIITMIGLVKADTINDVIEKQNTQINLTIPCINNGTICSNSATCRLTVQYPNNSYMVNYQSMNVNNGDTNYKLPDSSVIGFFPSKVVCCDSGLCGTSVFRINITPTGDVDNLGFYIMLTIVILGFLLIGVFIKNIPLTLIGSLCAIACGIYIGISGFNSFINLGTQILAIAILAFGMFWGFLAMFEYLDIL